MQKSPWDYSFDGSKVQTYEAHIFESASNMFKACLIKSFIFVISDNKYLLSLWFALVPLGWLYFDSFLQLSFRYVPEKKKIIKLTIIAKGNLFLS